MYKFVKGSRLFMQGTRESADYDNIHDTFQPTTNDDDRNRGGYYYRASDPRVPVGGASSSSAVTAGGVGVGSNSNNNNNNRRSSSNRYETSSTSGARRPPRGGSSSGGGQGGFDHDDGEDEIRAVHTMRKMNVEGNTEWERSARTVRRGGIKTKSTRTVRKVTTVTRGEQSVTNESVMSYSSDNQQKYPAIAADKKSLKFRVVHEKVLLLTVGIYIYSILHWSYLLPIYGNMMIFFIPDGITHTHISCCGVAQTDGKN